jgi:hypothetical protein
MDSFAGLDQEGTEASERRSRREDATNTAATAHTLDDAE